MTPSDRAVAWLGNLTLSDDYAGQRLVLRPWQEGIVRSLNEVRPDGLLKYRRCLLLLPRKQAKTQLAASLSVYHILGSGRTGQSAVVAASDREQASHLFRKAVGMIEADPYLSKQCRVYSSAKRVEARKSGNSLQVLSSDGRRLHGHNPSLVVIDEVHTQPNRELYDALTSAFGARREYLTLLISTQGNRKDTLLYQEYEYAKKVRDGIVDDPEYLPIIFEAAPGDDWTDEAVWHKAMPALGDFCNLEFIRSECRKAREVPSEESKFRQLYLNHLVAAAGKWLNRAGWDVCNATTFDPDELAGRECYGGLDMSNTSDLTAFVLVFPREDGTYRVRGWYWIPEGYAVERDAKGHTQYGKWAREGRITLTEGAVIDHDQIRAQILDLAAEYQIREIRVDPFTATQTASKLMAEGLDVKFMRQGTFSMNEPTRYLEVLIATNRVHAGKDPVLDWQMDNAVAESDTQGNVKISKHRSSEKVDAVVALVMALSGAMVVDPSVTPEVIRLGPGA